MVVYRYPIVRRDLPGRDLYYWLEDDQLIIRVGIDYTDAEVEHETARISRECGQEYDGGHTPLIPVPVPFPHRHVAATTAAAAVVTIAASLAIVTGPARQPHTPARPRAVAVMPADDTASGSQREHRPDPATTLTIPAPEAATTTPTAEPAPTLLDSQHPIRGIVRQHPVRAIAGQHPIQRLLTPLAADHPARRLLQPTPKSPLRPTHQRTR